MKKRKWSFAPNQSHDHQRPCREIIIYLQIEEIIMHGKINKVDHLDLKINMITYTYRHT